METNYKIIGGDGREYGPVTLDELKTWVRDGRVGRQTQVWRSDMGTWIAAIQYQELQPDIGEVKAAVGSDEMETVGFWPRLGAYVLDQVALIMLSYLIFGIPVRVNATTFDLSQLFGMRFLYDTILSTVYYVGLNGYFGATLGKMVIGAKIVNLDGSKIGFLKAFLRMLASFLSGIIFCIGYLMVAFREDKRGLHDLIVGTRVIYKR